MFHLAEGPSGQTSHATVCGKWASSTSHFKQHFPLQELDRQGMTRSQPEMAMAQDGGGVDIDTMPGLMDYTSAGLTTKEVNHLKQFKGAEHTR